MQDFACPALLRCRLSYNSCLRLRGFHPLWPDFPIRSADIYHMNRRRSYNPGPAVTGPVWALARSLATTCAITVVFFSSGYLDVSVPRVRLTPCVIPLKMVGCPIRKSVVDSGYLPLATAYRSLSRPSSPSRAKASFMCPFLLSF